MFNRIEEDRRSETSKSFWWTMVRKMGSLAYVRNHFPEVSLLPLAKNVGFAAGNNAGYEQGSR